MNNKIVYEGSTASVAGLNDNSSIQNTQTVSAEPKSSASNNITDMLGKILPMLIGIGGISMLFGKGLFGIGGGRSRFIWWILG